MLTSSLTVLALRKRRQQTAGEDGVEEEHHPQNPVSHHTTPPPPLTHSPFMLVPCKGRAPLGNILDHRNKKKMKQQQQSSRHRRTSISSSTSSSVFAPSEAPSSHAVGRGGGGGILPSLKGRDQHHPSSSSSPSPSSTPLSVFGQSTCSSSSSPLHRVLTDIHCGKEDRLPRRDLLQRSSKHTADEHNNNTACSTTPMQTFFGKDTNAEEAMALMRGETVFSPQQQHQQVTEGTSLSPGRHQQHQQRQSSPNAINRAEHRRAYDEALRESVLLSLQQQKKLTLLNRSPSRVAEGRRQHRGSSACSSSSSMSSSSPSPSPLPFVHSTAKEEADESSGLNRGHKRPTVVDSSNEGRRTVTILGGHHHHDDVPSSSSRALVLVKESNPRPISRSTIERLTKRERRYAHPSTMATVIDSHAQHPSPGHERRSSQQRDALKHLQLQTELSKTRLPKKENCVESIAFRRLWSRMASKDAQRGDKDRALAQALLDQTGSKERKVLAKFVVPSRCLSSSPPPVSETEKALDELKQATQKMTQRRRLQDELTEIERRRHCLDRPSTDDGDEPKSSALMQYYADLYEEDEEQETDTRALVVSATASSKPTTSAEDVSSPMNPCPTLQEVRQAPAPLRPLSRMHGFEEEAHEAEVERQRRLNTAALASGTASSNSFHRRDDTAQWRRHRSGQENGGTGATAALDQASLVVGRQGAADMTVLCDLLCRPLL